MAETTDPQGQTPVQPEDSDSELNADEMEGVVGGGSSGHRNARNNSQSGAAYHSEDDKRDG